MLAALGRKTVLAGTVEQALGFRRLPEIWRRQLRWAVCRRCEAPAIFHAELLTSALVAAIAGAAGAGLVGLSAGAVFLGTIAAWIVIDVLLSLAKGWPVSWRSPAAQLCFMFAFPALWLRARFARRIFWGDVPFAIERPRA
jgi:ceramide glucosyltransferase